MPGLGTRLGRGGATTTLNDLANSDCIVIMGSNMAENHPVGFRFVMKAKERGATVIHIDPRFSRTSAMADLYVPLRAGSDLIFLGALVNYMIEHEAYFDEYVRHYTNAATLISDEYRDAEDLDGVFSGFDPAGRAYDPASWSHQDQGDSPGAQHEAGHDAQPREGAGAHDAPWEVPTDPTLQDPHCVFQIVKRHFARYTPELVEQGCGVPKDLFLKVAEAIARNSGRERTTVFCYAVAWTQHTTGSQTISCCALLQLLLGNIGRPGGGIMALRGHSTIQGSTDIPTYMVSLLKAWYGDAAHPKNDFAYDLLPKIDADHSFQAMLLQMKDGVMQGLFCMGMNPAVGGQNAVLGRQALANLEWLVVRDVHEIESAAFWYDAPEVRDGTVKPTDIKTEIFFLPGAIAAEKEGSYTNTHRLVQWHDKAVEPPGDCRSEADFLYKLGLRLRELYADDDSAAGRQIRALTWDYPTKGPLDEIDLDAVVREINGYTLSNGTLVSGYAALKDDGSTACGCWIYSGIMPEDGKNLARSRTGDPSTSSGQAGAFLEWGFAWPGNRRILYNRCSADPQGRPWSERKAWIWWDDEQKRWVGHDVPDFPPTKPPDYQPTPGMKGLDAHAGDAPFVRLADGKGALFVPSGLRDGPLPTHYEPWESPVKNPLYPRQGRSPVAPVFPRDDNRYHAPEDPRFPYVLTTYRLTEHHTAGGMSRWVPWLAELQPEGFAEISRQLGLELGIDNGDWVVISTLRGEIETRALVTERVRPLTVNGRTLHQIGMPWHFGFGGIATGAIANDLTALVEDPNSRIHEAKAFTCNVRPGRLCPNGAGRPAAAAGPNGAPTP